MIKINPEIEGAAIAAARKIVKESLEVVSGTDRYSVSFAVMLVDSEEDIKRQAQKANYPLWIPLVVDGRIFRIYF
jgi:hypothetical protein